MLRICGLYLLVFCFFLHATAALPPAKRDSLLTILKTRDQDLRQKKLIMYLRYYFGDMPANEMTGAKAETDQLMESYRVRDRVAINYFIETLCQMQPGALYGG